MSNTKPVVLEKTSLLSYNVILPALAFVLPFLISGPQLLTGTLVNSLLYLSANKLSQNKLWFVAIIPSLGALANGVVLGKFTPFLVFFLPCIWLGNIILIKSYLRLKKILPLFLVLILVPVFKTALLYSTALIYFQNHLVPQLFVTTMGILQFATAVAGGILATFLLHFLKETHE